MKLVRCSNERATRPSQLKAGKLYWVDEASLYKDSDGDNYVDVYADAEGKKLVGYLKTSHFVTAYDYLKFGMSLSSYVNSKEGNLLQDIIAWCKANSMATAQGMCGYNTLAENVLKYIKANKLDKPENMKREYLVRSAFTGDNLHDVCLDFMGYSVVPNE